jgi:hypothetical protein
MRVYITKDCYDGSKSKIIEADLDGMSMSSLIFMLMTAKVASITITKKFDLERAISKMDTPED